MLLENREIVVAPGPEGPRPEAVFDLSEAQASAVADALSHHQRANFGAEALDADRALALRALSALADQVGELAAAGSNGVLRVGPDGAATLVHAVVAYLDDRDTEGYQPPEERERLAMLHELLEPLMDLTCELRSFPREQRA
jgi:hypothetical protein